jgi:uncharacterized protein involved in exopolysaccharide biosynthesis
MSQDGTRTINNPTEISIRDVILKIQSGIRYLKSKWLTILFIGIIGGFIGLLYTIINKTKYTASCTFVLDEGSRGGGLSQYAGLASMAGIDLGGGGGSEGLFQGDNILELYKSRLMIEKALLSEASFNGGKELLINRYITSNKLRPIWKDRDKINQISFDGDPDKFDRTQDSLITSIVEIFNKNILLVTKPDKKLSIISVEVTSIDELFAKNFADKLVETVNNFYIQTKTKKASEIVRLLQKQVDSVRYVLNSSISGVASAIDAAPNANPSLLSLRVPSQRKQVDVQASTAIYSEIVKNLELSKMKLRQETPLIQVIDKPVLPLKIDKLSKLKGIIIGMFFGMFFTSAYFIIKKLFNNLMNN